MSAINDGRVHCWRCLIKFDDTELSTDCCPICGEALMTWEDSVERYRLFISLYRKKPTDTGPGTLFPDNS